MKECRTCINREYKDELMCCQANHVHHAFRELLKNLPVIGKWFGDYECQAYEAERLED